MAANVPLTVKVVRESSWVETICAWVLLLIGIALAFAGHYDAAAYATASAAFWRIGAKR